jgi:hypothetical protein
MTEVRNDKFKEGDLVAHFRTLGHKIPKAIISVDKLMPQLTPEEIVKLRRWMAIYILVDDDPDREFRRELLSEFDSCPCCQGWLGHNRPPTDNTLRQKSFDFDR